MLAFVGVCDGDRARSKLAITVVIRWGWALVWHFFQQSRFLCHQGNFVLGLCMHNFSWILDGPLHVLSFCSKGNFLLQRADRNGAGVPGLARVFLQEVLQILPIMQVFFVVIQYLSYSCHTYP